MEQMAGAGEPGSSVLPFLRGFMEAEFEAVHQDCAAAIGTSHRIQDELGIVKSVQATLLEKVEGASEELRQLREQAAVHAACLQRLDMPLKEFAALREMQEKLLSHNAALVELRGSQGDQERVLSQFRLELNELIAQLPASREQLAQVAASHAEAVQAASTRQDLTLQRSFERKLAQFNLEVQEDLQKRVGGLRHEILAGAQQERLHIRKELEKSSSQFGKDLESLRVETRSSLNVQADGQSCIFAKVNEHLKQTEKNFRQLLDEMAAKVTVRAALDEQLWLTDQRLSQRIDDLSRAHFESQLVLERRLSVLLQGRLQTGISAEKEMISLENQEASVRITALEFGSCQTAQPDGVPRIRPAASSIDITEAAKKQSPPSDAGRTPSQASHSPSQAKEVLRRGAADNVAEDQWDRVATAIQEHRVPQSISALPSQAREAMRPSSARGCGAADNVAEDHWDRVATAIQEHRVPQSISAGGDFETSDPYDFSSCAARRSSSAGRASRNRSSSRSYRAEKWRS